jgi:hypothetical protein
MPRFAEIAARSARSPTGAKNSFGPRGQSARRRAGALVVYRVAAPGCESHPGATVIAETAVGPWPDRPRMIRNLFAGPRMHSPSPGAPFTTPAGHWLPAPVDNQYQFGFCTL